MENNNKVIILLGSNIDPSSNIAKSLILLSRLSNIISRSRIWETKAEGSDGPNFLNTAVEIETSLDPALIKNQIIIPIETELKRIRTSDKYAPRTIDLDIILFNERVLDREIWRKIFIAIPVSELRPDLKNPDTQETLEQIAENLKNSEHAELSDFQPG